MWECTPMVEQEITELERSAFGISQQRKDCFVVVGTHCHNLAVILLSPSMDKSCFHVNFIFDSINRRKQRSTQVNCPCTTFTSELSTWSSFQVSCSFLLFRQEENCAHRKSVMGCESDRMRILSFSFHGIEAVGVPEDALKWRALFLPRNEKDDSQI